MRTASMLDDRPASDLTARARLRDTAIECFAESGFAVPVRTIAAAAGVSPGLIAHHFGSKQALRQECDAEVLRRYQAVKAAGVGQQPGQQLQALMAPGVSATLLVYLLRAILDGGPTARAFLDHLIDDSRPTMADAVASGLVRPSRDEEARLRYLTYQAIGTLIVHFVTSPAASPEEFVTSLRLGEEDSVLPMLEMYTEGLLADRGLLDEYVRVLDRQPQTRSRT